MDNIDEIAELAMKNFLDAGYKEDSARYLGKQYVLRKFRNYSDILGKGIEHMLSDEMMYSVGAKKGKHLFKDIRCRQLLYRR